MIQHKKIICFVAERISTRAKFIQVMCTIFGETAKRLLNYESDELISFQGHSKLVIQIDSRLQFFDLAALLRDFLQAAHDCFQSVLYRRDCNGRLAEIGL